jgi:hypothetical protein
VLACELDRLRTRQVLRQASLGLPVPTIVERIMSIAPYVPWKLGKWIRGVSLGAALCRLAILAYRG